MYQMLIMSLRTILFAAVGILVGTLSTLAQEPRYKAGFKIISLYDSSRNYKPNASPSDKLRYRPVDIDLWYPAAITSTDTTASFTNFVSLLEERSNFYDDSKNYAGLTEEVLQYVCAGLNCPDSSRLKKVKTESYVNAKPITEKFPLIVYLAAFNGMSYENYLLFENLAKKGFIVASVSSIGRYPGNMTMDTTDLFEQVNDAAFIIEYLTKYNLVSENVGLVGYSWGGLSASILAMLEPQKIKAVVSLDGSEQLTFADLEDARKLSIIKDSKFFKPEKIKSSYLYLDSDVSAWDDLPDSIYHIVDFIPGDKTYLKINGSTHEDFSCLSVVSGENNANKKYFVIQALTTSYLLDKLKGQHVFSKQIPTEKVSTQFSKPALIIDSDKNEKIIRGFIRDKKSNAPLPYVNIGIVNKDKGTTTNVEGKFELKIGPSHMQDTLRISIVGYEPKIIYLNELMRNHNTTLNIRLKEKTNELKEVVLVEKKLTTKILGNKTQSKFFGGKFGSNDLGSELAIRIKIKKAPTYLDAFDFNISYNTADTATFRINIYDVKNGIPDKSMLEKNIILHVGKQTGKIKVDLSPYNIVVYNDFFVGLEWVDGNTNSGIVFSAGLGKTYYRKASQGRWKKHPMGAGFNVTAKY